MKKKLFLVLTCLFALFAIAGCYNKDVLAIEGKNKAVAIVGANEVKVNGEWVANAWDLNENNLGKALSLADVAEIDKDLAKALKGKDIKYIYTLDIRVGAYDAGWTSNAKVGEDVYTFNGSCTVKAIEGTYDADDKAYSQDQWISDPKTAHVESLTPSTLFFPTWQEAKDEDGFAWDQNPVIIGGAGEYTIIIVKYNAASTAEVCGYGMAAIKTADAEYAVEPVKVEKWVWADHTYEVIGGFNDWADAGVIAMTKDADGNYVAEVTFAAAGEFKVRADGAWTNSWGADGGNASVAAAGTYIVKLDIASGTVTATAK